MKLNCKALSLLIAFGMLGACSVKTETTKIESPKIDIPNFDKILSTFVCNKSDSEQPSLSADDLSQKIVVEDQIETKDLEIVDCEGKVTKSHGPERNLSKVVEIAAPELSEDVTFVKIENSRTCVETITNSKEDSKLTQQEIDLPNGEKIQIPMFSSEVDRSGKILLNMTDSLERDILQRLNVLDGANVIKITYFGKCLKFKAGKSVTDGSNSSTCESAKVLMTEQRLIEVKINRPEVTGIKKINACSK